MLKRKRSHLFFFSHFFLHRFLRRQYVRTSVTCVSRRLVFSRASFVIFFDELPNLLFVFCVYNRVNSVGDTCSNVRLRFADSRKLFEHAQTTCRNEMNNSIKRY